MAIVLYQSRRGELEKEIETLLRRLENQYGATISHNRVPAVAGELAGEAVQVLLSDNVQAFTTAVEIGAVIWSLIEAARAVGRHFDIGKNESKMLAANEANDRLQQEQNSTSDNISPSIWGPMEAVPESGIFPDGYASRRLFQVAVILPWRQDRARTYWYLIGEKGDVFASWHTQTFRDRLPEFLKPENHSL